MYEAKGLLAAANRTIAGYRLYDERDVELLTFIRRARTLGLHLDDIREVLAIQNGGIPPCASVSDLVDNRIAELDATVAELLALRDTLAETRQRAANCNDEQTRHRVRVRDHRGCHRHHGLSSRRRRFGSIVGAYVASRAGGLFY